VVVAAIAHDRQQPGPPVAALKTCKVAAGAQVCFLNHVLRLSFVTHQPASKIVCRIQVLYEELHITAGSWMLACFFAGCKSKTLYHDVFSSRFKLFGHQRRGAKESNQAIPQILEEFNTRGVGE
jgi:hypothetical protein